MMNKVLALIAFGAVALAKDESPVLWDMLPDTYPGMNTSDNNLGICFGSNTNWAQYPYVVALRYTSGSACCTGSILSLNPAVILTAAHCSVCTGPVVIGCNNPLNCDGTSYTVSSGLSHPSWNGNIANGFDVRILRLASPITVPGAQTVTVPQQEVTDATVRITGYGQTQTNQIPTQLQTGTSRALSQSECNGAMGGIVTITSTMYCIMNGAGNTVTMCSGDSGGPIVVGNTVYGINSFVIVGSGPQCNGCYCCPGYPQVGANAATLSTWINQQLSYFIEEAHKEAVQL